MSNFSSSEFPNSSDCISRQDAIDAVDSETVSTNPEHFKSSEKFIKFMDDVDIASFGKWQWANGFNTALVATRVQLKKLPSAEKAQLSEEDATKDATSGLIKKQDAIDAILGLTNCDTAEKLRAYVKDHDLGSWWSGGVLSSIEKVERLPSAEPKTPSNGSITSINSENTHDRTMGDCISRKDAIKSMGNAIWHYPNELYTGLNSYEMSEALAKDGLMFLPSTEPDSQPTCNQLATTLQPTCNNLATDTISRQDAIKSMAKAIWHYPNELYTGLNSYEMCEALAKDGLMFLPSAEGCKCPCEYREPCDDCYYDAYRGHGCPAEGGTDD